jgi:hypothetical protein
VEYVRVKRTTIRSKKTKRKTVTDEEQEEQIEEDSERSSEVEEEVLVKQDNSEVTTTMSNSEEVTTTKAERELRKDKNKSKEKSNTARKVDPRKSKKKESALEKDKRKTPETSNNKETEIERKSVERSKGKTNKKIVTEDSSRKTMEETESKDTTRQSSVKKVAGKGVSQVDAVGGPKEDDKDIEIATAKETVAEVRQKGEAHEQLQDPAHLLQQEGEDGTTRAVVTALVHQHEDEGSTEASHAEEQIESGKNGEWGVQGDSNIVQATGNTEQEEDEAAVHGGQADTEEEHQRSKEGDTEREQKSREVNEGEGDIKTKGDAEGTDEEKKPQTEFGVEKGVEATNECESEDVISRETGRGLETDINEREETGEDREGNAEVEGETKFREDSEKTHKEGDQEDTDAEEEEAESQDKCMNRQVNSGGSPAEEVAQKLEHDINGVEEAKDHDKTDGDSRASTQELISSPLEKEEGAAREFNTESGASTARSPNGGDSSMLLDSGFEPSPRRDKSTTRSNSGKQQQTRSARQTRGRGRGRIPRPCRTDGEQPTTTVSVTQAVQRSMRK